LLPTRSCFSLIIEERVIGGEGAAGFKNLKYNCFPGFRVSGLNPEFYGKRGLIKPYFGEFIRKWEQLLTILLELA